MLFNSYIFIFIFFPLCITGFYLLNRVDNGRLAKIWLIALSLWFYGYFNLYYLGIMIFSILLNHVLANAILCGKHKKALCTTAIVANLGVLFYFKYFDFFITNVNAVFGSNFALMHILLPLGISFFTFQQIGFIVDTYRGDVEKTDLIDYALFVSFFPQLIAGPIVSSEEMLPQFKTIAGRKPDSEKIARGLTLFILGLSKKVLIADTLGVAVDAGYEAYLAMNGLDSFLIMILYTLQLYFDFSGYCDMARGLAQMLGFELPVNFDSPYKSENIVEFWKRWHKTLTRFFTRYVYIPLGGNRKGTVRMLINIAIVYFLSGLWHGAGYNFIIWGMLHGVLYIVTRIYIIGKGKRETIVKEASIVADTDASKGITSAKSVIYMNNVKKIFATALTFLYVSFAWIFFRAESVAQACVLIKNMFTGSWKAVSYPISEAFKISEIWYALKVVHLDRYSIGQIIPLILITTVSLMITFAFPNAGDIAKKIKPRPVYAVVLAMLGLWCVLTLSNVSTFLYFNF